MLISRQARILLHDMDPRAGPVIPDTCPELLSVKHALYALSEYNAFVCDLFLYLASMNLNEFGWKEVLGSSCNNDVIYNCCSISASPYISMKSENDSKQALANTLFLGICMCV